MTDFIKSLVQTRLELNSVILAERNKDAKLLGGADLALIGVVHHAGEDLACYDAEILKNMGLGEDKMKDLTEVCFLQRGFLDLDSVYLATLSGATGTETLPLPQLMKKRAELGAAAHALILECSLYGIDLPQALAQHLQERSV